MRTHTAAATEGKWRTGGRDEIWLRALTASDTQTQAHAETSKQQYNEHLNNAPEQGFGVRMRFGLTRIQRREGSGAAGNGGSDAAEAI